MRPAPTALVGRTIRLTIYAPGWTTAAAGASPSVGGWGLKIRLHHRRLRHRGLWSVVLEFHSFSQSSGDGTVTSACFE